MKKIILCILDGWAIRTEQTHNAVVLAKTHTFDTLINEYGYSQLTTHGEAVGLPIGQMGNSEVGHMTIGAGRILLQGLSRIDKAIEQGEFTKNKDIHTLIKTLQKSGKTCHILGLLSDGGVHSHISHIKALSDTLTAHNIHVCVHAFLDGRDVAQKSALDYIRAFPIATVSGRYYAMDRDNRWERIEKAYNAIVSADAPHVSSAQEAIEDSYAHAITDEFIPPAVIGDYQGIQDGDGLICANFRADRVREILSALLKPEFNNFIRSHRPKISAALGMVEYSKELNTYLTTIFPPYIPKDTLPEVIANHGMTQLRIAETEKYAHVTFFFSGGREEQFPGEERILIPSPKVATYDLKPEMSAQELTKHLTAAITSQQYDLIIANYANPDMVGHSGNLKATIAAIEAVDKGLGDVWQVAKDTGTCLVVTADHGNSEEMIDKAGKPHTAHTLNPVPFIIADAEYGYIQPKHGTLVDITPTILHLFGLDIPTTIEGNVLV